MRQGLSGLIGPIGLFGVGGVSFRGVSYQPCDIPGPAVWTVSKGPQSQFRYCRWYIEAGRVCQVEYFLTFGFLGSYYITVP